MSTFISHLGDSQKQCFGHSDLSSNVFALNIIILLAHYKLHRCKTVNLSVAASQGPGTQVVESRPSHWSFS